MLLVRHLPHHFPQYASIARTVVASARGRRPLVTPGPWLEASFAPPSNALIRDYLRWCRGSEAAWAGRVPVHLFPLWTFPQMVRALVGVPYDLSRGLNGGVTVAVHAPWPADERVHVRSRLSAIDADDRRVLFTLDSVLGPRSSREAMQVSARFIVPLRRSEGSADAHKRVPDDARELARWDLPANAGRQYAFLTGDVNPIHVSAAAGRAAGLRGAILHGYGTMALALEGLLATELGGRVDALAGFDIRWARPVDLPSTIRLFAGAPGSFTVGPAPGAPAQAMGTYTTRATR